MVRLSYRKWDTPTDAISRKVFDRFKDVQVRRHVQQAEMIRDLAGRVQKLEQFLVGLSTSLARDEEEE